jgi:predicted dehydrogenase
MAKKRLDPVRVGVVGIGDFGRLHALTLDGLAEAEVVALVDRDTARLKQVGQELGGVAVWDDLDEALPASGAEAWVIAASTAAHIPLAHRVLSSGCFALIEKPLAQTLSKAQSLAEVGSDATGRLMMGHIRLFNSEFRQLMMEVRRHKQIRLIDSVCHRPTALRKRFPNDALFELLMVHDLYTVQAIVDGREPVAITGREENNLALAELRWEDGLVARLTASMLTPAGMAADGYDRLEVFGDGWAARIQPNPRPIEVWQERARWPMGLEIAPEDGRGASGMLADELRCFCRVVRGLESIPDGARYEDAMQVQRWLDRLLNSK